MGATIRVRSPLGVDPYDGG
ncbi:uncharacterized protein G2W53_018324 [Senna tora]|uniref:Uncharacterized protein n=1 Tax=Senna tora TaxID=362788 RepID=A0A834TRK8_9FABA|nr:uncharacterized protein G2W53_018324 [Senna tora]